MNTITNAGINYSLPQVTLLQESGLGTSEFAGRTAYNSFSNSEHTEMPLLDNLVDRTHSNETLLDTTINHINNIDSSELLTSLAWVHHHHSVIEHCNLTFLIRGTSRGVLQEHARHRIQSLTVQSTRYTMQELLHAFNATSVSIKGQSKREFTSLVKPMKMFVVQGIAEDIEIHAIYDRLHHQLETIGSEEFGNLSLSKEAKKVFENRSSYNTSTEVFNSLKVCKAKRNAADYFKWVVTDNFKCDLVVTSNIRSLKNYFELRANGAAWFQMQWLAEAMMRATPKKYLELIVKPDKLQKVLN